MSTSPVSETLPFQKRVVEWLMACFSMEVCRDGIERNHRFLEEALELVQSLDCTRSEAHQLVDYVFDRPIGDPYQELGGTLLTLTALANCHDMDLEGAGETELARVWTKIDKIRAKQAAKPAHSPLPQHVGHAQTPAVTAALQECVEVLELVEHPRREDPDYGTEVAALGDRIGYGALMSSASASWRKFLEAKGMPLGSEFVAGPCQATVTLALRMARAALSDTSTVQPQPDWNYTPKPGQLSGPSTKD